MPTETMTSRQYRAFLANQGQAPVLGPENPPREQSEAEIQREFVRWVEKAVPPESATVFAVPNGEKRSYLTACLLKAAGVLAGASDLVVVMPGAVGFLETKKPGGKMSEEQKTFAARVRALGHRYAVYDSVAAGEAVLREWGVVL